MNFFATDFTALSNLLEVIYALTWCLFYVVLGSIPIHFISCVVKKEKLYSKQKTNIDYFPETSHVSFIRATIKQTPQKSGVINHLSYNQLRQLAKRQGIKLKNPNKSQLIAALS